MPSEIKPETPALLWVAFLWHRNCASPGPPGRLIPCKLPAMLSLLALGGLFALESRVLRRGLSHCNKKNEVSRPSCAWMEAPLCPSFNVVVVVAVCLDGPGPGPLSWLPGDGDGDECVSRAHPLGRRWKWRAAKLPRPSSAQHWRLVGNQCRDRSWTTPRRRRRHSRGSWLTDKPHQIPRVTSGQAPPHQRWLTRRGSGGGGAVEGAWESGSSPSRRPLDAQLSLRRVVEPLGWDKKGNLAPPRLLHDNARFSLEGSNRAGAGNGEVFENKLSNCGRRWSSHHGPRHKNRGYLGDGRPQTRANRESRLSSRLLPRESSGRSK